MATTITKLFPTGILQSSVAFDEVTYSTVKVSTTGVYASQFDEVNLAAGTAERRTSTGTYLVSGYFDEYTLSSINGSLLFSGSNYLSVAGGTGTAMSTSDFTWECWVYPTASTSYQAFIDSRTNPLGGGDTTGFYFGTNYNTITPMYYTNGLQLASSIDLTLNAWNHVALTRASGTVTIWVNGASGGTYTGDTTDLSEQRVFIGSSGTDLYLTGRLSNLRIVKGTAVYTSAFTPPTTALTAITNTQLLLNTTYDADFLKDSSSNNFTVTNNGSVTSAALAPF